MYRHRPTKRDAGAHKTKALVICLCLAALAALLPLRSLVAESLLTMDAAINAALKHNPDIRSAHLTDKSAAIGIDIAESDFEISFHPEVGVRIDNGGDRQESYGMRLAQKTAYGTEITLRGISESMVDAGRQKRLTLQIAQPLFRRAGKLVTRESVIRASQARLDVERNILLRQSALVVQVVTAYQQVLRLDRQLDADRQSFERSESLYRLTLAKERLGRTTQIDVLRVQLQRGQSESRVNNTLEQRAAARRDLAVLMGVDGAVDAELASVPLIEVAVEELESAIANALSNRLEIASAFQQFEDSERASRIAKKNLLPDLQLVARFEKADDDVFLDHDFEPSRQAWSIHLETDTDLRLTREKALLEQALLARQRSLEGIRQVRLSIARDVEQGWLAWHRAGAELKVLEDNFELAAARLKLARRLFALGRSDGFSVTDAEDAYFVAQSRLLAGRSDAVTSSYRLLHSMGTLIEVPDRLKPEAS